MSLSLNDILSLPHLENFHLISGKNGLSKKVRRVNILDFEFEELEPEPQKPDGIFEKQALVLSTFLYAKNQPEKLLPCMKQLKIDGVSALAIKTVYLETLPREVLAFSEENDFPVFLFQNTDFEKIIVEVMKKVESQEQLDHILTETDRLLDDSIPLSAKNGIIQNYFPHLPFSYYCECVSLKDAISPLAFQHLVVQLRMLDPNCAFHPYRNSIFMVSNREADDFSWDAVLRRKGYYQGRSLCHRGTNELIHALQESFYAADYARMQDRTDAVPFEKIGLQQVLLPNSGNYWMQQFCSNTIRILKALDSNENCVFTTIVTLVKNHYDITKTAEELSLHKNSVRYRFNKAWQALGFTENNPEFQTILYLSLKFMGFIL